MSMSEIEVDDSSGAHLSASSSLNANGGLGAVGGSLLSAASLNPTSTGSRGLSLSVSMNDADEYDTSSSDQRFHISLPDFRRYVSQVLDPINEISADGYDEEMEDLHRRCVAANFKQLIYPKSSKLHKKNRYSNVLPYTRTRVHLGKIDDDPDTDYINASHVCVRRQIDVIGSSTKYICTQAPVLHTVGDFWRMVWEQESNVIVMLTPLTEKDAVKSDLYWPKKVGIFQQVCDGLMVHLKSEEIIGDTIDRKFEIFRKEFPEAIRTVYHLQYTAWPDHGVPSSFDSYLDVVKYYRQIRDRSTGPVIVHCSAGIGRTGTFIGIDIAVDHFASLVDECQLDSTVCIVDMVYNMRSQRPGMVQTKAQYMFIYAFLKYCLEFEHFGLKVSNVS